MKDKKLDLVCFSYLAPGTIFRIRQYPQINYGTEILETIETLAADGPMVAIACARLGLNTGLITNPVGKDERGNNIVDYFNKHKVATKIRKI